MALHPCSRGTRAERRPMRAHDHEMWTSRVTQASYMNDHDRPLPGLHRPPRSASCSSRTSACRSPTTLERYAEGAPLVDGTVAVGGTRPARRVARRHPRHPRHRRDRATHRRGRDVQGPGLRRHRPDHLRPSWSRCATSSPRCCAASTDLPARGRARHPAGAGRGRRAGRAARARGLHPQPRQGDRPRRHRPARVRRRRRRGARSPARWRSCSPPSRPTSPARSSGSAPPAPRSAGPVADWPRPLDRQGRPGHRRQPRHRRADRPGAAPRRRDRRRRRRTPGRQRAPGADAGARRRPPHPRHHRARTRRSGSPTT